jgi:hypothetical protein
MRNKALQALAGAALLSLIVSWNVGAQGQQQLLYSVLFSDSNGITHFRLEHLTWEKRAGGSGMVTPFLDASKIGFLRIPKGLNSGLHPAPAKQFVMVLTGLMEVESGDGERRQFLPGSVLLVTDTQGSGHRTSVLGDQDVFLVWVPVP